MASTDAKPLPQKNVAYRVTFPIYDADGDLVTGATGLDSEISKDGGTFTDCTNEATEIATSSGMYYLDLTSTEMNADTVAIIVKTSSSGAKTTPIVMYPEEAGDVRVNVTAYGGTAGTFSGGRPEVNTSHWAGTAVGSALIRGNLIQIAGVAVSTSTAQLGVNVVNAGGTAWGSGAITAAAIATGAIDADALSADAGTEIGTAVWATAARTLTALDEDNTTLDLDATIRSAVGIASANLDTQLSAIDTVVDSILVDTAEIGAAGAGLTALATQASVNTIDGNVDLILEDTGTTLPATLSTIAGYIDTEIGTIITNIGTVDTVVDAIKAKTDSLTFTVAGSVDSNIQLVNDVEVTGTGVDGDTWGPA